MAELESEVRVYQEARLVPTRAQGARRLDKNAADCAGLKN